jgi:hypothetical protein
MSKLVSVEIPTANRAPKRRFPEELVREAVQRLKTGETLSLGETYEKRARASVMSYHLRQAVAAEAGIDAKQIRSRTFETTDGFTFAVFLRPDAVKRAATRGRGKQS